jgi:hypothetical protein
MKENDPASHVEMVIYFGYQNDIMLADIFKEIIDIFAKFDTYTKSLKPFGAAPMRSPPITFYRFFEQYG